MTYETDLKRMMEMAGSPKELTTLAHYSVTDPELIKLLSAQDGSEMDVDDDGKAGILTVDTIMFPNLAKMANQLALQKKIKPVAGPSTRDVTGQTRPMGVQFLRPKSTTDLKEETCNECGMYESKCKCDNKDLDESLARMRNLAGIKEAAKPDFPDVDKDGNKKEPIKKAVKDKEEKKMDESVFAMTNLWKAYKG